MIRELLFSLKAPYRDPLEITGFRFGKGEKACCIVGAIRGNEIQQQYVCSQLVKALRVLEGKGLIAQDHEILVIPSAARRPSGWRTAFSVRCGIILMACSLLLFICRGILCRTCG